MRVTVIGDVMLDAYLHCEVTGLSPEDDLSPKLLVKDKTYHPGGAANVARCLAKWGDCRVYLVGVCGEDRSAEILALELEREGVLAPFLPRLGGRRTTTKTRLVTPRSRQAIRMDEETTDCVPDEMADVMFDHVEASAPDVLVISDYAKGVVTDHLIQRLSSLYPKCATVVDPKQPDFSFYGSVFAVTPNRGEMKAALSSVKPKCLSKFVVVTDGQNGSSVLFGTTGLIEDYRKEHDIPVRPREVGDPSGCGDTYVAQLAYSLGLKMDLKRSCLRASAAGALTYDALGVSSPSLEDIEEELKHKEYQ